MIHPELKKKRKKKINCFQHFPQIMQTEVNLIIHTTSNKISRYCLKYI